MPADRATRRPGARAGARGRTGRCRRGAGPAGGAPDSVRRKRRRGRRGSGRPAPWSRAAARARPRRSSAGSGGRGVGGGEMGGEAGSGGRVEAGGTLRRRAPGRASSRARGGGARCCRCGQAALAWGGRAAGVEGVEEGGARRRDIVSGTAAMRRPWRLRRLLHGMVRARPRALGRAGDVVGVGDQRAVQVIRPPRRSGEDEDARVVRRWATMYPRRRGRGRRAAG